jgi:hypothetical protein
MAAFRLNDEGTQITIVEDLAKDVADDFKELMMQIPLNKQ